MVVNGKVILLTGASMGIGKATALLLASKGAKLALAARSIDKLQQLSAEIPGSFVVHVDMRDFASVKGMVQKTLEHFGRIDVLINNAGQSTYTPVELIELDAMRSIMELNVYGPIVAMQAVIPLMRKQGGGAIVNISSGTTQGAYPTLSPYAATKAALNMVSNTARVELERDNIVVSLVLPGLTATDFQKNSIKPKVTWSAPPRQMPIADPVEKVADKILEAIETGAAQVSLRG